MSPEFMFFSQFYDLPVSLLTRYTKVYTKIIHVRLRPAFFFKSVGTFGSLSGDFSKRGAWSFWSQKKEVFSSGIRVAAGLKSCYNS